MDDHTTSMSGQQHTKPEKRAKKPLQVFQQYKITHPPPPEQPLYVEKEYFLAPTCFLSQLTNQLYNQIYLKQLQAERRLFRGGFSLNKQDFKRCMGKVKEALRAEEDVIFTSEAASPRCSGLS